MWLAWWVTVAVGSQLGFQLGRCWQFLLPGRASVLQVGKIIFGARLVRQCASECAHILAARPHDGNRSGLAGRPRAARHQQVTAPETTRSLQCEHSATSNRTGAPAGPSATAVPVIGVPGYPAGRRGGLRVVRRPSARRPPGQAARGPRATARATGVRLDLPVRCRLRSRYPWPRSRRASTPMAPSWPRRAGAAPARSVG